ncbi:MAG: hypothetical protein NT166_01120 [Candidatus Aminicenantes bacterium]|nr:hypothetical protein [Candidatus Aminicenantes bacterium]
MKRGISQRPGHSREIRKPVGELEQTNAKGNRCGKKDKHLIEKD